MCCRKITWLLEPEEALVAGKQLADITAEMEAGAGKLPAPPVPSVEPELEERRRLGPELGGVRSARGR